MQPKTASIPHMAGGFSALLSLSFSLSDSEHATENNATENIGEEKWRIDSGGC
jgi:hypothetical protein